MHQLLKFILIAQLLSLSVSAIAKFWWKPLTLFFILLINFFTWFVFWIGAHYLAENPQRATSAQRGDFIRWLALFYFSLFAMAVGAAGASFLRLLINASYTLGGAQARDIFAPFEPWSTGLLSAFGLLLAAPIVYILSEGLKFIRPRVATIKMIALWAFLTLFLRPLLSLIR